MHVSQTLSCHDPDLGDIHFVKLEDCSDDIVTIFPHLLRDVKLGNLFVQIREIFDTASPEVLELCLSRKKEVSVLMANHYMFQNF